MGKRVRSLPALYDLDFRKKIVDGHKDYQQILSYPQPPIEKFAKSPADIDAFIRIINDGFAELIDKERDHFPGWVAQISLAAPDAGVAEAERAIKNGALGVQIYTNVAGSAIDHPKYRPFWKKMNELGSRSGFIPRAAQRCPTISTRRSRFMRSGGPSDGPTRPPARWTRLVYSKIMDENPNLKIITHHFGGIVPMLEGRLGPGNDVMGSRTSDEDYVALRKSLKKRPLDYFKAGLLRRHRCIRRRTGDTMRHGILPDRQDRVRLRLPVRSGRRHDVSACDPGDSRQTGDDPGGRARRSCTRTWKR